MAREGASRTAIRMALDLLRAEGLVRRLPGVGTVAVDKCAIALALGRPGPIARTFNGKPSLVDHITLSLIETGVTPGVASSLDLHSGDKVIFTERLTLLDHLPISLASLWFPAQFGERLFRNGIDLARRGIFDVLEEELGFSLGMTDYSIEATVADSAVAALLAIPEGSPILLRTTLGRLADGQPVSFGYTRDRADRIRYSLQGVHPRHLASADG